METADKNNHKKKKKNKIRLGRFVIFAVVATYIIMFVNTFFVQKTDKTVISYGNVEVSEIINGYITRNEKIVTSDISGELYPVINEGERVSKGERVAVVRNDNSNTINDKINELRSKLNSFSTPSIFNNDVALIDSEVSTLLNKLMLNNYNETYSELRNVKNIIEAKLSKKASIIGENSARGSAEREYYEQLKQYETQLMTAQDELKAPIAGTVAYKLDGYENVFAYNAIGNYDKETLENLNVPSGELVSSIKINSFKIVDNIEGYVTVISSSERALNAKVDKKVKLRFPEIDSDEITGEIEYVTIENGQAVITFRINRKIEDLINYRKLKVEIIWDSKSGMQIPSSSIRKNEDGSNSIFIINGKRLIERKVDIVTEWNGVAIINKVDGNLYLYDSIALDAQDLNEEKSLYFE